MRVESEGEPGTSQSPAASQVDGVDAQKEKLKKKKKTRGKAWIKRNMLIWVKEEKEKRTFQK